MILSEKDLQLLPSISQLLERMVFQNDTNNIPNPVTIFHAVRSPSISLRAYIERIAKYAKCSPNYFVLAMIYIDRLIQKNPSYALNSLNIHRLLITSVVLACKYSTDFFYNNNYYATVGGVPVAELNALELEFLYLINFHLYVNGETFERYKQHLSHPCFSLAPLLFSTAENPRTTAENLPSNQQLSSTLGVVALTASPSAASLSGKAASQLTTAQPFPTVNYHHRRSLQCNTFQPAFSY